MCMAARPQSELYLAGIQHQSFKNLLNLKPSPSRFEFFQGGPTICRRMGATWGFPTPGVLEVFATVADRNLA